MKRLEFYNGTKTYMYPNGEIANSERIEADFPAITTFKHIIETDEAGEVCYAVQNFSAMKSIYNIEEGLSDNEALKAIEDIINAPTPEPEPTAEERIASALEFQSMMMLPDEEE